MDVLTVFSWFIYGAVVLFLCSLWFVLVYVIFRNRETNEITFLVIFVLWIIPVSLFIGAMAFYATKYLILLGLIK